MKINKNSFMKNIFGLLIVIFFIILSCSTNDKPYIEIPKPQSPVLLDLTRVPYSKLSEYKFFDGELKNEKPSYGVIPYEPVSSLFSDYAEKKRFIWLPNGAKATYNGDGNVLELPIGSVLIKTFYYNNVQPSNSTRIIETRLMIRKSSGWIFAEYVWNQEQTEAVLQTEGGFTAISWFDANNSIREINYRIPSPTECATCHTINQQIFPIGIKPQNLNANFNYIEGSKNQLSKWIEFGYLENNIPTNIVSMVDYNDASKSLNLRVRSYFDINCAHCHQDGGFAAFFEMRFPFSQTNVLANMGVCVTPNHFVPGQTGEIVKPSDTNRSILYYRMMTSDFDYRMPFLGRSIKHTEGVLLVEQWINSLTDCE